MDWIWYLVVTIVWFECIGFSYISFKSAWIESYGTWTSTDRNLFLFWSLGGPVSLAVAILNYWTVKTQ